MLVFNDVFNKRQMLIELQSITNIAAGNTLFVGDESKDLAILDLVSLLVAPATAVMCGLRKADVALTRTGGNSCIRKLIDEIVKVHD
jgi:3-deoxy-D-manno-octulosonate 8-phosphate phosphatase KdsC-like HAD superfamily phosphatase